MKKQTQKGVNTAVVHILSDHGQRITAVQKSIWGLDKRLRSIERWGFGIACAFAVVAVWWEVQLKDTLFPKRDDSKAIELILHEIKAMKAAK